MTTPEDADSAGDILDGAIVAVAEGTSANYQYMQEGRPAARPAPGPRTGASSPSAARPTPPVTAWSSPVRSSPSTLRCRCQRRYRCFHAGPGAREPGCATKCAGDLGALSAGVTYSITHGLNTTDVGVWFKTTDDSRVVRAGLGDDRSEHPRRLPGHVDGGWFAARCRCGLMSFRRFGSWPISTARKSYWKTTGA